MYLTFCGVPLLKNDNTDTQRETTYPAGLVEVEQRVVPVLGLADEALDAIDLFIGDVGHLEAVVDHCRGLAGTVVGPCVQRVHRRTEVSSASSPVVDCENIFRILQENGEASKREGHILLWAQCKHPCTDRRDRGVLAPARGHDAVGGICEKGGGVVTKNFIFFFEMDRNVFVPPPLFLF